MTEEANAAIGGAFDGGADEVVVSDSHGDMGNLLPHKLDARADLVQGTPKVPLSMMTGIDDGFAMAAFVGYHAGAGTPAAILDHTYTGFMIRRARERRVVERDPSERRPRRHLRGAGGRRGRRSGVLRPGEFLVALGAHRRREAGHR